MAYYKRKIYLINPKFQIKFSLLFCVLVCVSSALYPVVIYNQMDYLASFIATHLPQFSEKMAKTYESRKNTLLLVLILWQLGFTVLVFIFSIFFSHKIAGPIYKLRSFFQKVREGENPGQLFFRKGDYFPELAEDFNQTFEKIQDTHKNDFAHINEISAYLNNLNHIVPDDKKVILNEINKKLSEIQSRFNSTE